MNYLLFPFALTYLILTEFRIFFYKIGIFKSSKLPIKVISIGNLNFGGTGKTPFTIELANLLNKKFKHILVISRGYRRQSKGPRTVSIKGDIQCTVEESGDEPYLIATKCSHVSVVVSENREVGYHYFNDNSVDLVMLDDAYQNLKIKRDLDILLTSGYNPFWKDNIFPMGKLRERRGNYKRAHIICVTKTTIDIPNHIDPSFEVPYQSYKTNRPFSQETSYRLITGIADTSPIIEYLNSNQIILKDIITLKDHADAVEYKKYINDNDIVMTEKDYVKLSKKYKINPIILTANLKISKSLEMQIFSKL